MYVYLCSMQVTISIASSNQDNSKASSGGMLIAQVNSDSEVSQESQSTKGKVPSRSKRGTLVTKSR